MVRCGKRGNAKKCPEIPRYCRPDVDLRPRRRRSCTSLRHSVPIRLSDVHMFTSMSNNDKIGPSSVPCFSQRLKLKKAVIADIWRISHGYLGTADSIAY